jgi:hypothetical protein
MTSELNMPGTEMCQYESGSPVDRLSSPPISESLAVDLEPMPSLAAAPPVMLCHGQANTPDMTGGSYER